MDNNIAVAEYRQKCPFRSLRISKSFKPGQNIIAIIHANKVNKYSLKYWSVQVEDGNQNQRWFTYKHTHNAHPSILIEVVKYCNHMFNYPRRFFFFKTGMTKRSKRFSFDQIMHQKLTPLSNESFKNRRIFGRSFFLIFAWARPLLLSQDHL